MFLKKIISMVSIAVITVSVVAVLHMYCFTAPYSRERKKRKKSEHEQEFQEREKENNSCARDTVIVGMSERGSLLNQKEAELLTQELMSLKPDYVEKILVTISNAAAFTENQDLLRRVGCLKQLGVLLHKHSMTLQLGGGVAHPEVVNRIASAINNLAVNGENQHHLKDCIPSLIEFAASEHTIVQLASLQALTNLSVIDLNHAPFTKLIQQLYDLMDQGPANVGLQALKILVNLSSNEYMVPHLLAAKTPDCFLDMLSMDTEIACLLRWTTVIGNVATISKEKAITAATLPCEYKAASPETLYTALYGVDGQPKVNSKVFLLTKHEHREIRRHATKLFAALTT